MTDRPPPPQRSVGALLEVVASPPTLDDLLARAEITDTLKRSVRGIDRRDRDLLRSSYHADATDDHGVFVGTAADLIDWATTSTGRWQSSTHHLADPLIRIDGDSAFVESTAIAGHQTWPDADGWYAASDIGVRYVDVFERRDGRWLIASRTVVYDWQGTVRCNVEDDLLPADALTGRRDRTDPWYEFVASYVARLDGSSTSS